MRPKALRTSALLSAAIALFSAAGLSAPANAADTRYITITASGSTNVVPDAVRITATVSVIGKTSKEALTAASTTSAAVRKL
jgi:uncharacterized protein YggE